MIYFFIGFGCGVIASIIAVFIVLAVGDKVLTDGKETKNKGDK